ncbi:hypothetical protein GQ37_001650 [Janthinobacterium sp. BJB1]|uniref:hypothetical protein n=1 Tax=Janthinobacterium sp. GW458P TaxID=1981504 RepID=UPI000A329763|nr:hypothetical protein [Janthinobacterium sp. GW458P]MBE3025576.1 hypothetical protein [Janthinobacterium sp. GW458P]PHV14359.1 hypothetical protein CSQ90_23640 [Janthinobacterium sp. BJB303]PJD00350.1 hypothetical protein GQ37_001650 [Janthinobacterium sp. BJB1]
MPSRLLQVIALTLAALGLAPGAAHLLELPVKLDYPPALYAQVTSSLYVLFGPVGGAVQMAAAASVAVLAFRSRRLPQGRLLAASAAALFVSLLLWACLVAPVNGEWGNSADVSQEEFAAAYARLRGRWEYGHVAAFIAWFAGWLGMAAAVTMRPAAGAGPPR